VTAARLCATLMATVLAGCASFLPDKDNTEPPAPLPEFEPSVRLHTLWQKDTGVGVDEQFVKLVPAVYGDVVVIADRKGMVRALDAGTGTGVWTRETGAPLSAGPGIGDGLVLVGTSDAEVIALDTRAGEIAWRAEVSSEVLSVPRIDRDVVVVQTVDGNVTALNAEDGSQRWIYDRSVPTLTLRGTSSPVLAGGLVLAGFASGKLAALGLDDGRVLWEASIAVPRGRSELERMVDLDADPVVMGNIVFVASYQGRVAAVDISSGRTVWSRDMSSYAGVAVDYSQLYVTDEHSEVWALDLANGGSLWKQDRLRARSLTAPEYYADYVALGDFEGYIHLLSRIDGRLAGRTRVDSSGILAHPVAVGGILYVYSKDGTLAAYSVE
jgi:outer membrane protein assembly factor BamB